MKGVRFVLVLVVAAAASSIAVAQGKVYIDSVSSFGGVASKKETVTTVMPLSKTNDWVVCFFSRNSEIQKCTSNWESTGYLALADAPIDGIGSFGSEKGKVKPTGTSGFDQVCLTVGAQDVDYIILMTTFKTKSCNTKIAPGHLTEWGTATVPNTDTTASAGLRSSGPRATMTRIERSDPVALPDLK